MKRIKKTETGRRIEQQRCKTEWRMTKAQKRGNTARVIVATRKLKTRTEKIIGIKTVKHNEEKVEKYTSKENDGGRGKEKDVKENALRRK